MRFVKAVVDIPLFELHKIGQSDFVYIGLGIDQHFPAQFIRVDSAGGRYKAGQGHRQGAAAAAGLDNSPAGVDIQFEDDPPRLLGVDDLGFALDLFHQLGQ